MDSRFFCYILKTVKPSCNKTYNGYTVNLNRRIRQHNSELAGGARYTTSMSVNSTAPTWQFYAVISGFSTNNEALSFEWWIKHPEGKRKRSAKFAGPLGRLLGLVHVLPRLNKYNVLNKYDIWIHSDFSNYVAAQLPQQQKNKNNLTFKSFKEHNEICKYYETIDTATATAATATAATATAAAATTATATTAATTATITSTTTATGNTGAISRVVKIRPIITLKVKIDT